MAKQQKPLSSKHSIINFGEYRTERVGGVLKKDPHYIKWIIENYKHEFPQALINEVYLYCAHTEPIYIVNRKTDYKGKIKVTKEMNQAIMARNIKRVEELCGDPALIKVVRAMHTEQNTNKNKEKN